MLFPGHEHCLSSIFGAEFQENASSVTFHCLQSNAHSSRNLIIPETMFNMPQHFEFSGG